MFPTTPRPASNCAAITSRPLARNVPQHVFDAVVVGSGAAGLACACRIVRELARAGVPNPAGRVAVVTRGLGLGTSNLSGSDKQTYYKLGAAGEADTPRDLAATLVAGGCMHGDVALAEATGSLRAFHQLVELGVPFPHDTWGTFVGYKTDHDPRRRATSAGPWTSRFMVAGWLAELERLGVRVFDRHHLLAVVTGRETASGRRGAGSRKAGGETGLREAGRGRAGKCVAQGILCADLRRAGEPNGGLVLFRAESVVVAGGGPGELYAQSVFPAGQMGPYAALFEAGAEAHNLTELQFGLASLNPRWNLSGTYQQVVPRYFSTDAQGGDEREFLNERFPTMGALATAIFLKGYQWPFDPDKAFDRGSSLVDVLVHEETVRRGRRVFMDFRENPRPTGSMKPFALCDLSPEARVYLERSGATQATPFARLAHMNPPSIALYAEKSVDLARQPLEIAVCAQHCNGGFVVDAWWETNVGRLFAIGEIAGTHGVKRPGGSALNAGQVGAIRAAQRIAHVYACGAGAPSGASRRSSAPVRCPGTPVRCPGFSRSSPSTKPANPRETARAADGTTNESGFAEAAVPVLDRFAEAVRAIREARGQSPSDASGQTARATGSVASMSSIASIPSTPASLRGAIQHRMSAAGGILRSREGAERALAEAQAEWRALEKAGWPAVGKNDPSVGKNGFSAAKIWPPAAHSRLAADKNAPSAAKSGSPAAQSRLAVGRNWLSAWETRELALAQRAFLEALRNLIVRGGGSRGSYFVTSPDGRLPLEALDADWAAVPENKALRQVILGLRYDARRDRFEPTETAPRPMPEADDPWFETVWADFREGRVFRAR